MAKPAYRTAFGQTLLKASRLTHASRFIQRAFATLGFLSAPGKLVGKGFRGKPSAAAANDASLKRNSSPSATKQNVRSDAARDDAATHGFFTEAVFPFGGAHHPYRLYVPASKAGLPVFASALPLIVLLHGCKQNALDFAQGTAMNTLADQNACMVLYPEQIPTANSSRCWNWFATGHQQRGVGEPGMIAALTQHVMASRQLGARVDAERIYIAGLSAGGAMAAVVAGLYPDIFAAVGVHSGLPSGAARGMLSAFGAMQRGAKGQPAAALPTIVFHGTGDRTVHPANGENISNAALAALRGSGLALVKSSSKSATANDPDQSTPTEKTVYRAANGPSYLEHWRVEKGPHAWSGGNASGSYTDPDGPSASAAMLAFFLQHRKQP